MNDVVMPCGNEHTGFYRVCLGREQLPNGKGGHSMFRTTVFISMVILAAASVSLAQPSLGGGQFSCFGGGGITFAAHYGCLQFKH